MVQERVDGSQKPDPSDVYRTIKDDGYHERYCDDNDLSFIQDVLCEAEAERSYHHQQEPSYLKDEMHRVTYINTKTTAIPNFLRFNKAWLVSPPRFLTLIAQMAIPKSRKRHTPMKTNTATVYPFVKLDPKGLVL
jgi:hypothetical protein